MISYRGIKSQTPFTDQRAQRARRVFGLEAEDFRVTIPERTLSLAEQEILIIQPFQRPRQRQVFVHRYMPATEHLACPLLATPVSRYPKSLKKRNHLQVWMTPQPMHPQSSDRRDSIVRCK